MNTVNFNAFIQQNYTIEIKGSEVDVNDLTSVSEFFLVTKHGSSGHTQLNSLFINTFAKEDDAVLVESMPSMQEVKPEDTLQTVWLNTKAKILGWDIGTVDKIITSKKMLKVGKLELQAQLLLKEGQSLNSSGQQNDLDEKLILIAEKVLSLAPTLNMQKALGDIVDKYEARTKSIAESTQTASKGFKRVFQIVPELYFKNEMKDPRVSCEKLKEFLVDRNVVVLFPKEEAVKEKGQELSDKLTSIYQRVLAKSE